jgi:polysaccharide deacetylase family protein (PEP-CTERM system associated)
MEATSTVGIGHNRLAPHSTPVSTGCLNCFSVDVEEYFQCEAFTTCVNRAAWPHLERRAEPMLERLGSLLDRHGCRATFFVLGWTVSHLRLRLRELVRQGHEIGCHGYDHQHLARLSPQQLREDLHRARGQIEDALGVCPLGYRAPTFSVTRATAWALDVIIAEGFEYDASVFPIFHDRYGVPGAPSTPFWARAPSGRRILEFPPLTVDCGFARLPVGGGGYLRLLPGFVLRRCVAARQQQGAPVMIYVHPWELDPGQPRLPVGPLSQWRHRVNLRTTEAKLERLLATFHFESAATVLRCACADRALPVFDVSGGRSTRSKPE